jgi:intracellular sulfur oxidation DsrE/DsrF family protein
MRAIYISLISMLICSAANAQQPHKIIWDLNAKDTSEQTVLFRQIGNVLKESPDTKIEVVYHGNAITGLVQDSSFFGQKVREFQQKGVIFAACNNSLKRYKIDPSKVLPGVVVVPVAILELIKKQEQGWSYIKM